MKEANFWNSKENCFEEAKKYKTVKELQQNCYGCYMGLSRNGWLKEVYPELRERKPNGYWDSKENCLEECKKHKSLTKLKVDAHGCYVALKKNGWVADAVFGCEETAKARVVDQKPPNYWNDKENCLKEAKRYNTAYELQRYCYGCYYGLKRNGWLYEAYPLKDGVNPPNYWNDKDRVMLAAKECHSKMEFKRKFGGAFNAAFRYGWMGEIEKSFEKPKVYADYESKIHSVYAYEIKEFNTCYIGRTTDVHKRDLSHRRSRKHTDGSETFDALYLFCEEKGIEIPVPIIKEDGLDAIQSLEREDFWLSEYIKNGWTPLNKAKTGRNSGSLGGVIKWDYESCKEACKNFKYKTDLKNYSYGCYYNCLKNGWFEEFGIQDKRPWFNEKMKRLSNKKED